MRTGHLIRTFSQVRRGVRTSTFASVGERSAKMSIYQGKRCVFYNTVEVMRLCSNPSWAF